MNLTLDQSGTAQQQAWVNDAIAACTYPLADLAAAVTVIWGDGPAATAHPYMCTQQTSAEAWTVWIEPWADDPNNPNLRGLPNPAADVKTFYEQSFVHELGHVIHESYITADDAKAAIARLFWIAQASSAAGRRFGTLGDYFPAETSDQQWAQSIAEAIAECVKCAFYTDRLIFMNRTRWNIDAEEWPALIAAITPQVGGFDEQWAADQDHLPLDVTQFTAFPFVSSPGVGAGVVTPEGYPTPVACFYQHTTWIIG